MKVLHNEFGFLQLFAEGGGDGGAPAAGGESSAVTGDATPSALPKNVPERAKKFYAMAMEKRGQKVDTVQPNPAIASANTPTEEAESPKESQPQEAPPKKMSYKELIESDEYKEDHERHIQKVLRDRRKRSDAEAAETNELLSLIGQKYGLDASSATFRTDLMNAVKEDDSVYEKYAEEHDIPISEAKRVKGLEEQLKRAKQEAQQRRDAEETDRIMTALRREGEKTKALYPDFDLDTAMKNPQYMRLVTALNGDTTQAYKALNHDALVQAAERKAAAQSKQAVANSVRSNLSRPSEGGISSTTNNTPAPPDFRSMGLDGLRAWASKQRKNARS